jgi:hypothetical protein
LGKKPQTKQPYARCQPWQPQIEAAVTVGLSAQRIYQDLVGEPGVEMAGFAALMLKSVLPFWTPRFRANPQPCR